ncbi:hypothetical protein PF008_g18349 [Phytophthora fragariae]|uniref:DDE-1 domain-containing protein n=1 Tax=Phytophthora fragariae TaxID=53985 RepID=A0A6G0R5W6_9STRA|nr:hypothetical protein PF008_g18349 [Phytophthora fragariae]
MDTRRLQWVIEMRKNKSRCVTTECLLIMAARYEPDFRAGRTRQAAIMYLHRFRRRNRLSVRRITHRGTKQRDEMEGTVEEELQSHFISRNGAYLTVQKKAYCNEVRMLQWIEEVWKPYVSGSRLLLLDSLKTHKMESVRQKLEVGCCTEVEADNRRCAADGRVRNA